MIWPHRYRSVRPKSYIRNGSIQYFFLDIILGGNYPSACYHNMHKWFYLFGSLQFSIKRPYIQNQTSHLNMTMESKNWAKLTRDKHNFYDELNYPNNALLGSNIPRLLLFCVVSQRHWRCEHIHVLCKLQYISFHAVTHTQSRDLKQNPVNCKMLQIRKSRRTKCARDKSCLFVKS